MSKNRTQLMDDLRMEIAEYVKFRQRTGRPLTFANALLGHRQVCAENSVGAPDTFWSDRISLLDEIAREEGLAP